MKIIAGPMLRHVSRDEINIWLVLDSKATNIDAEIRSANGSVLGKSNTNSRKPIRAGQNIYVYLLKLVPGNGRFPSEKLLNYDLIIDGQRLADFGFTSGKHRITYGNDALPGLVLKDKHQVILQGSCRKPHAAKVNKSQPDMMATADSLLQSKRQNIAKRPSMLFLTGDQIYADDVAAPMLAKIKNLVKAFIVHDEAIPKTSSTKVRVSSLDLNGRSRVLSAKNMGFSSSAKDNHLLSFGEYFMMYCVVWGGFDALCPKFDEIENDLEQEGYEDELEDLENEYSRQRLIVESFLKDAYKARRLLANIPTYMIFDDHEISDDWNLDEGNYKAFRNHLFSRHVQTNALSAYWLCQGWGNTPDAFKPGFKTAVQQYLNNYPQNKFAALESALLDQYWGYELDTYPYTVVLDTRTKREYNPKKLAKLMSPQALAEVAKRIKAVPASQKTNNSLLLVSAAPVYGFTEVERKQLAMAEVLPRRLDVECWIADELAYKQLQSMLIESGFDRCAIFSGDVHYGFCRHEQLVASSGSLVQIFQLTSSSLHNAPGFGLRLGLGLLEQQAFNKHNTPYLIPKNEKDNFINQSTNLGVLELNNGNLQVFTLNSEIPSRAQARSWFGSDKGFSWVYDLINPQRL